MGKYIHSHTHACTVYYLFSLYEKKLHKYTHTHKIKAVGHNQHFHVSICCFKHRSLSFPLCFYTSHTLHLLFSTVPCCASFCLSEYDCVSERERERGFVLFSQPGWGTIEEKHNCVLFFLPPLFCISSLHLSVLSISNSFYLLLSSLKVSCVYIQHSPSLASLYVPLPPSLSLFLLCRTAGKPTLSPFSCSLLLFFYLFSSLYDSL